MRYRWKETDIAKAGSFFFFFQNPNQLFDRRGPKQRQTPASFLTTSAPPPRLHESRVEAADPGRSHPEPRSRPGVPRRRPTSPHPRLTSFSQASRSGNPPEWVGTHSSNNSLAGRPNSPACEVFLGERCRVSEVSFPLPQALELLDTSLGPGSAFQGDGPGHRSDFFFPPTCGSGSLQQPAGPQPLPVGTASGRTGSTTPKSAEPRDLQGLVCDEGVSPSPKADVRGAPPANLAGDSKALGFCSEFSALWVSKPQQPAHFESLIFRCFFGFLFSKESLGTVRTASRALHFLLREGRSSLTSDQGVASGERRGVSGNKRARKEIRVLKVRVCS